MTRQRTAPGMGVYVQFPDVHWLPRQRGVVVRCFVEKLGGEEGVEYGVGIQLTAACPELRELATLGG